MPWIVFQHYLFSLSLSLSIGGGGALKLGPILKEYFGVDYGHFKAIWLANQNFFGQLECLKTSCRKFTLEIWSKDWDLMSQTNWNV